MPASTLVPGSSPPSPGFDPWAILISICFADTRYWLVTPKRPLATCFMLHSRSLPKRSLCSPPSPVPDLPPIRFMAIASVSWTSWLSEPKDIEPVENRRRMAATGSTSDNGTGAPDRGLKSSRPRMFFKRSLLSSMPCENSR